MKPCVIRIILGELPEGVSGRWIESTVTIHDANTFRFRADLCVRLMDGTFSIERIEQSIAEPFTAECILSMLTYLAHERHMPTETGLVVCAAGDIALSRGEVARLLKPEIRVS